MKGDNIRESGFWKLTEGNVTKSRTDTNFHAAPIKSRKRILQSDPKLPDHFGRIIKLLLILILCQMFVLQTASKISNVPRAVWFR